MYIDIPAWIAEPKKGKHVSRTWPRSNQIKGKHAASPPNKSLYRQARVAMFYPADWWCMCSMQYEYEKTIIEFCGGRTPGRPSRSRRQGADTVSHVLLRWHRSCLGKLCYPQKARQLNFACRSRSHGPFIFQQLYTHYFFSRISCYIRIYLLVLISHLSPFFSFFFCTTRHAR